MKHAGTAAAPDAIVFEFVRRGACVKVTAADPDSLLEVSVIGPAAAPEAWLRQAALRKLDFVRRRRPALATAGIRR